MILVLDTASRTDSLAPHIAAQRRGIQDRDSPEFLQVKDPNLQI